MECLYFMLHQWGWYMAWRSQHSVDSSMPYITPVGTAYLHCRWKTSKSPFNRTKYHYMHFVQFWQQQWRRGPSACTLVLHRFVQFWHGLNEMIYICMIFVQSNAASCEITLSVIINVVCCRLQDLFTDVQHVALMWLFRTSMWSIRHALSSANPVTQDSLLQVSMKMELWSASVSHLCHCFSSLMWYWQTVWALLLSFYQYTLCSVHRFCSVVKPQKPVKMYS